ncbi:MAG TPA: apolipoprotein N-acyltransferase [Streptosporangiaceae bacterium]|nr:apolipoprotein N-acyltransferase [Streptosporangiaceae bacterium]
MTFGRSLRQPVRYAALASGAIPVLAFPAANLEFLGWIGLVPGLAIMRAAPSRREAIVRGWWFGAGYLLAAMYWLAPNLGPGLLLVAIVIGSLWSAVGLATWSWLRPPVTGRRAAAAFAVVPSSWLVSEWVRSWQGIGGPWAVLGASQWQHPAVLALAAVGGVWLITFALVAANTGLLIALVGARPVVRLAGLAAALAAVAAGPIAFALAAPVPAGNPLTIALVQPGSTNGPAVRLQRNEQLTQALAGRADLVVWGESSVGYDLADHPAVLASIEHASRTAGAEILVDQDARNPAGAQSKQATLISRTGIQGSYTKTRLVPFGEYIPFRSVLGWLTSISRAAPTNVIPGTGAHVLHAVLPDGQRLTFGVLICFESAFPDMSRVDADHGARVIIYQTSDFTFQASWAPAQHAALSAIRAAETGRPVVQAALTGDSVAFDPRGRVLAWAGTGYTGALVVHLRLPPTSYRTLFDRFGDFVPWAAVAIAALAALAGLARNARARRRARRPAADAPSIPVTHG